MRLWTAAGPDQEGWVFGHALTDQRRVCALLVQPTSSLPPVAAVLLPSPRRCASSVTASRTALLTPPVRSQSALSLPRRVYMVLAGSLSFSHRVCYWLGLSRCVCSWLDMFHCECVYSCRNRSHLVHRCACVYFCPRLIGCLFPVGYPTVGPVQSPRTPITRQPACQLTRGTKAPAAD